jgi:hypothetical protein
MSIDNVGVDRQRDRSEAGRPTLPQFGISAQGFPDHST